MKQKKPRPPLLPKQRPLPDNTDTFRLYHLPTAAGRFRQLPKASQRGWEGIGKPRKCLNMVGKVSASPESVPTRLGRNRQTPKVSQRGWEGIGKPRKRLNAVGKVLANPESVPTRLGRNRQLPTACRRFAGRIIRFSKF